MRSATSPRRVASRRSSVVITTTTCGDRASVRGRCSSAWGVRSPTSGTRTPTSRWPLPTGAGTACPLSRTSPSSSAPTRGCRTPCGCGLRSRARTECLRAPVGVSWADASLCLGCSGRTGRPAEAHHKGMAPAMRAMRPDDLDQQKGSMRHALAAHALSGCPEHRRDFAHPTVDDA